MTNRARITKPRASSSRAERDADGWLSDAVPRRSCSMASRPTCYSSQRARGGDDDAEDGISLFLVPRDTAGISAARLSQDRRWPGGRGRARTKYGVGADALLGEPDAGLCHARIRHRLRSCSRCARKRSARWMSRRITRLNICVRANSSAYRSAASRRCSIAWRICCSRSNRRARRSSMLPPRWVLRRVDAGTRAVGGEVQHRADRRARRRRMHPVAWRHRHDVGTAARALRQATCDDRPSAR